MKYDNVSVDMILFEAVESKREKSDNFSVLVLVMRMLASADNNKLKD